MVDGSKVLYFEQVSERLFNISSYSISLSLPPYLLSFTLLLLLLAITCFSATNISVFTNFISIANARHSGGPLRSPFARYIYIFLVELYCSFTSLNHDT